MMQTTSDSRRAQVLVALIGLCMALVYAAAELVPVNWDPAGVIGVGEDDTIRVEYIEGVFGRDVPLTESVGHDGRFFFIQATDPLLLDPDAHAAFLDRPTYRSQRMLYPALAGLAGPGGPEAVAWAMIGVNVVAFVLGTVGTARLAVMFGLSPWWGLAFAANPGVRFELDIGGGGVVAFAAVVWGLVMLGRHRVGPAVVLMSLSVLAREVMLVAVVGAALARGVGSIRDRAFIVTMPVLAAGSWWGIVQWRAGGLASEASIQELGLPFDGFIGALRLWLEAPGIDMVMGVTYLALSILMLVRAWRRRTLLELPAAGFGLLALLLTRQVWYRHFDISRALSPILTLFLLSLAVSLFGRASRSESSDGAPLGQAVNAT